MYTTHRMKNSPALTHLDTLGPPSSPRMDGARRRNKNRRMATMANPVYVTTLNPREPDGTTKPPGLSLWYIAAMSHGRPRPRNTFTLLLPGEVRGRKHKI